jgi:protein-L-isoaspartate(D-aspartate) O-methyltransferase
MDKDQLLYHLEHESKVFKLKGLKEAFTDIDRADFLSEDYKPEAYEDYAIPIGHGQNLGKPTVIAFMLELLEVKEGDNVLEIGSSGGWTAALIAHVVGKEGKVLGVELVPELKDAAAKNLSKYKFSQAEIVSARGKLGDHSKPPYDRILVTSSSEEFPNELADKLKIGGVLVLPIGDTIHKITRAKKGEFKEETFPGFMFSEIQ